MKKISTCAAVLATACFANPQTGAARPLGIDVSSANGAINWAEVFSSGIQWAYARAASNDGQFGNNMVNGKAAGVQMGPYWFAHPALDTPATEANSFWNIAGSYIKADGKTLSPAIDFELFSGHDGASTYTAWFNDWSADVKAKTSNSMKPVIYVAPCSGACDLTTNIKLAGWIASYNGENINTGTPWSTCLACNAWDPNGTGGWTYWQTGDTAHIMGIAGAVDLDVFNGTLAQLKSEEGVGGL